MDTGHAGELTLAGVCDEVSVMTARRVASAEFRIRRRQLGHHTSEGDARSGRRNILRINGAMHALDDTTVPMALAADVT